MRERKIRRKINFINSKQMGSFVDVRFDIVGEHKHGKQSHTFEASIHYLDKGKGVPLVLVHGIGQSLYTWFKNIDYFVGKGYRVIALDLAGFGYSSHPNIYYTVEESVIILKVFLEKLNIEKAHFVGFSTGALSVVSLAHEHPQTGNDGVGTFQHQAMITCEIGLALATVENDEARLLAFGYFEFYVAGKGSAPHADEARSLHPVDELGRRRVHRGAILVDFETLAGKGVDAQDDRRRRHPARMRPWFDRAHCTRDGGVQGGRDISIRSGDHLTTAHVLPHHHQGPRGGARVLRQRQHVLLDERHPLDRQPRRVLVLFGMNTVSESLCP